MAEKVLQLTLFKDIWVDMLVYDKQQRKIVYSLPVKILRGTPIETIPIPISGIDKDTMASLTPFPTWAFLFSLCNVLTVDEQNQKIKILYNYPKEDWFNIMLGSE